MSCYQTGNAPHPQQFLSAISDFVALSAADEILSLEPAVNIASFDDDTLSDYCFLTSIDRYRYQCPISFNICKPPDTYHEAMARPDSVTWLAAMCCEINSLEAHSAFEQTTLPSD